MEDAQGTTRAKFRWSVRPAASGWDWTIDQEIGGKWRLVRHGWASRSELAEKRAEHAYQQLRDDAALEARAAAFFRAVTA